MADLPHYPDSNGDTGDDTGVGPDRGSTTSTPHWVKVFTLAASHRALAWSGTAGIVAPLLFLAVAITHGLLRADHSLVSMPISALAAGSSGWIQDTNFIVTGLLMVAFAAGIHRGARQSRAGVIGPAFLALSGLGLIWAGIFPATDATGAFQENRPLHMIAAFLAFPGAGIGLLVLSRRLRRDPEWRGLAAYGLTAGTGILALFIATGALVVRPEVPLHAYWGLAQLALLAVWFPCVIALAWRVRRFAASSNA